jgi:hypothetical protein
MYLLYFLSLMKLPLIIGITLFCTLRVSTSAPLSTVATRAADPHRLVAGLTMKH